MLALDLTLSSDLNPLSDVTGRGNPRAIAVPSTIWGRTELIVAMVTSLRDGDQVDLEGRQYVLRICLARSFKSLAQPVEAV